jgi:hypothetical protein
MRLGYLIVGGFLAGSVMAGAAGDGARIQSGGLDGRTVRPFVPEGAANVLFFVQSDCPISNGYAPEIQRICRAYAGRGVSCHLVYEDVEIGAAGSFDAAARTHLREFRYERMSAVVDRTRVIARHAGATITPQAVVVDGTGSIRYSGRIDNRYAALGRPRQHVTEHDLRDALDALLAGRPVSRPRTEALGCHIVDPSSVEK